MEEKSLILSNFRNVHEALASYVPPIRSNRGAYTLERMKLLMGYLGNPQNDYQIIHVAGTSGKTSTCYYIASLLTQSGVKTGLTVSPHIDEINERVQINGKPISEKLFVKEFTQFMKLLNKSNIEPTYFELLTAFAFWEFKRQGCAYAVVEVGLGGLLDATNVIASPSKINVITDIGIDHEEVLGKTRALIASQKAGIIKPHNTVICYEQDEEVMEVIREAARQQQAELHEIWPVKNSGLPTTLPLFQRRNWYLAFSCYQLIASRDHLVELDEKQLTKSIYTYIPARMETLKLGSKTLLLDGSHNQQKLHALIKSMKHTYPRQKFSMLISLVSTKQAKLKSCLMELLPIAEKLYITSFHTKNGERVSVDPLKLAAACEELGFTNWEVIDEPEQAYAALLRDKNNFLLVTGSFYLLNHIRARKTA